MDVPHFDTDALLAWSDPAYDYITQDGYVRVPKAVWAQLRADAVAAAEHIELMVAARMTAGRAA